jgi:gliding motility-associated lipoprotein GldH
MRFSGKPLLFIFSIILTSACQDMQPIVDSNTEIDGRNWSYTEKVRIPFTIEDQEALYNIYINIRHSGGYRYSNIFLLIHIISPDGKRITERREFRLALPDGEWLGSGSGNMYSYQLPFKEKYKFRQAGKYIIELEQNMRDNPLDDVTDAGVKIEIAD